MVRRGRRAGRSRLVVHVLPQPVAADPATADAAAARADASSAEAAPIRERAEPTRVGFVVSKAVGNAVTRHAVARRLRHLMRDRIPWLPPGTLVVVRALKPAASATSRELGRDLDAAFRKTRLPTSADGPPSTERT